MAHNQTAMERFRPPLSGIRDILLNAVIPAALYKVAKGYYSASDLSALTIAAAFPLGKSGFELLLHRRSDPISVVVLLGIAANLIAIVFGGSPRLLLLRESIFTGTFGVACFVSLLLPRPMMFYFARYFIAGADMDWRARFNSGWEIPQVRFCHRLITTVWGCVFVGEFLVRVTLIHTVSPAWVLVISPIAMGTLTILTLVWSFSYGYRVRTRVLSLNGQSNAFPAPQPASTLPRPG
jgi:hypothetical protein